MLEPDHPVQHFVRDADAGDAPVARLDLLSPDKAVEALTKYGGTVLKTSLSKEAEKELQKRLHGDSSDPAA